MELNGGKVLEIYADDALDIKSSKQFKGNIDINKLNAVIEKYGKERVGVGFTVIVKVLGGPGQSVPPKLKVGVTITVAETGAVLV